ncbi:tetratricopeptide repeat protein [Kribbella sp. NBC_00382]|uniref:tetratricopeptide repeat protein n=1 Tax=Kribbella sp. NBC_00382 TaxID=2975967 RepID=UPI002E1D07BA
MPGKDHLSDFMKSVSGTVCLLCGVRTKTFWLVMDSSVVAAARAGESPYGQSAGGFDEFSRHLTAPGGTSAAAGLLRGQLSKQADGRRRSVLEAVSDMVRADYAFDSGEKAMEAGDTAKAAKAYKISAGTGKPAGYRAAVRLGELAAAAGDSKAAIKWYRQATATAETDVKAVAHLYLGNALRGANRLAEAYDAYRPAIVDGPVAVRGLAACRAGQALENLGRPEEAKVAYRQALTLGTHGAAEAAVDLGALAEDDGDWAQARKFAEYAVKSDEPRPVQHGAFNLARYWEHRRRSRKARKYYRIAARGDDEALALRARAALRAL